MNLVRRCVLVAALTLFAVALVFAQEKAPAATARSDFERAEKARQTGDLDSAVPLYHKAIEAAPDNLAAHTGFVLAVEMQQYHKLQAVAAGQGGAKLAPEDAAAAELDLWKKARAVAVQELTEIYQKWVHEHPEVAAFRYELVKVEHGEDGTLEGELKALTERYPKFAPSYADLAHIVVGRGDLELERSYYRKAMALEPDNAQYVSGYVSTFEMRDPEEHRRLAEEMAQSFPNDSVAVYALHFAAAATESVQDRIALLERAQALSEPLGTVASSLINDELLNLYARRDIGKAAAVSQKTLAALRRNAKANKGVVTHAEQLADYYGSVARGRQLLADGKTAEAASAIERTQPPPQTLHPDNSLTLLKADLLLARGQTKNAYQYLLDQPGTVADEGLRAAAECIGKQLDRTPRQVESDAWAACLERAKRVPEFSLDNFQGGKTKPADYRGRIVVINLWAPS
jgi:tetratricopeptide (TPR) repeat protein